ncbi:EcsC family protein [Latilactobacillus curvatus]|uniref:EcsC family protein n=1 Tax=Latilactobacillus curvatus TaxID=28038 RepID=A0AAJ5UR73_LATCU|nr:EcsC family protein [Latilactobacillus curvatus]WDC91347.1 EcsC family protein [Latilactobacillus curvatus]
MENQVDSSRGIQILNTLYGKCLDGVPKVSKPVEVLAQEYIQKYGRTDKAIDKLIKNQLSKNTFTGFVTGFGGLLTMPITLPADLTSVMYVQMRMVAVIAIIKGYDLKDDGVQTFVYGCLVGNAVTDILKQAGIEFGNKVALTTVKKIPGKVLININKAIGFRFITKAGTKGTINLAKAVPVIGAGIGASADYITTLTIARRAKKVFEGNDMFNIA